MKSKKSTRHIIIKFLKTEDKEKLLKVHRGKGYPIYKGIIIHMKIDFSSETLVTRRKKHNIFQILEEKTVNYEFHIW